MRLEISKKGRFPVIEARFTGNIWRQLLLLTIEIIKYSIINWHYTCSRCLFWGFEEMFGPMTNDILEFSCENEDFLWQERRGKICTIGSYSMNLEYRIF